ncbi:hypothetical protein M378DRAFT_166814 [Amanita muscaria Koide BX008]|uniref:Uncharacterized protein n=1 Tax=Amanita muscaria (strain Koide BX008) TaxID=946122 RepID=A0A0C2WXI9_AMAMK|nr:hypothetical protein M378DRAFT_166814 [Amanita muscaria Koide BX008]
MLWLSPFGVSLPYPLPGKNRFRDMTGLESPSLVGSFVSTLTTPPVNSLFGPDPLFASVMRLFLGVSSADDIRIGALILLALGIDFSNSASDSLDVQQHHKHIGITVFVK